MLPEMALADAYAIPFEFVDNTPDRVNDLSRYYQHPTYDDMIPGHYTDDTQRSIANATMVLDYRANPFSSDIFNPIKYVDRYQQTFRLDPRAGYSRRYEAFLKKYLDADAIDMALAMNRKPTNGSVMGAAVLGFLPDSSVVKLAAAAQALSTHSYPAIPFAQITALSAHYFINDVGPKDKLISWLLCELEDSGKSVREFLLEPAAVRWGYPSPPPTTMGASSPVRLMLWALPRYNTLSDLVRKAVDVGGDTDSAAAVMVAVASESREYTNDLPKVLWDGLENGRNGLDYLRDLDKQLREW